jgi:hypothetical protein
LSTSLRNSYKATWSGLSKPDWDYITFGSGYRSNYKYNDSFMDLGGEGTYYYTQSKSRTYGYKAIWSIPGNICATYSLKLWRNFRDGGSTTRLDPYNIITPTDIYNNL